MHPYVNTAITAVREAAKVITRHYEQLDSSAIMEKGAHDFVTNVDKTSEAIIIDTIKKAYPEHGIWGEETGQHPGNEYTWIIDPLDGTTNYIHGFPQFAISIGIQYKNQLEHGVIYDPLSQELYTASRGEGAQLNNRRIRVSQRDSLDNALIGTYFDEHHGIHVTKALYDQGAEVRKNGSAALNLAYVAAGRLDGFWEIGLKPWDLAAGIVLVREAGGFVNDYQGGTEFFKTESVVAGTRKVHESLLKVLQP